jgi:hypothetical protein
MQRRFALLFVMQAVEAGNVVAAATTFYGSALANGQLNGLFWKGEQ